MDKPNPYLQAALTSASNLSSGAVFKAEQLIAAKDVAGCYSLDFISALAMISEDEVFDIRGRLRSAFGKDLDLVEFKNRVKAARFKLQPKPEFSDWHGKLICGEQGPKPILANAIAAIRHSPDWKGVAAFDEFALRVVKLKPPPWVRGRNGHHINDAWTDTDSTRTAEWLQHNKVIVNSKVANEAVTAVAQENGFHPVREYLNSLKWDGVERIGTWLMDYMGVAEASDYNKAIGECWLLAAVKRIFEPGCQSDYALIFEGKQGRGKTQTLKALGGRWYTNQVDKVTSKDASMQVAGVWIVEFAELDKHGRSEDAAIKDFLTRESDRFRPPYGYHVQDVPRQCVFAGSLNPTSWIRDETGGRRYWPVKCGKADLPKVHKDRDQLWAEAMVGHRAGKLTYLVDEKLIEAATSEQDDRYEGDAWDDIVHSWIEDPHQEKGTDGLLIQPYTSGHGSVTITDILLHAVIKPRERMTQADQNRVSRILTKRGWIKFRGSDPLKPSSPRGWRYKFPEDDI